MLLENRLSGRLLRLSWALSFPLYAVMLLALYGAFVYAPTERVMGEVQRIFYFHVASAWTAFLAFFFVFLGGLLYLIKRNRTWDHLAAASAEVGVVFTTIVLVTGPIWARPIWNTWWPWGDPRVTTTLVLWLIYVAYLILRASLPEGERKYKFCAVFGIIGFIDVPIVWMSVRWWRTIHPVVITPAGVGLEPEMVRALIMAVVAFTLMFTAWMFLRMAMRINETLAEELQHELQERGS
jgi:heme exporter protein C